MCGSHDHQKKGEQQSSGAHAGHGASQPADPSTDRALSPTSSSWQQILRSPTAWLAGAFLLVAAYFAVIGQASRILPIVPYVLIGWMLLHHLGGHGSHGGGKGGGHQH